MDGQASRLAGPMPIRAVAGVGLAWNLFGVVQFAGQLLQTESGMMRAGMTSAQVDVLAALPVWMDVAFGAGTIGGVAGCLLLFLRNPLAAPAFGASLLAYVALFMGDILHGVFAAFGAGQVAILTLVVAIAAGLSGYARHLRRQGILD